jgi:hypothetical protein
MEFPKNFQKILWNIWKNVSHFPFQSMGEFQHLDDLSAFLKKTALCFTFIFAIARWKGLKD